MKLRALPAFSDNYIWMLDDGANALVVDPGDASPVLDVLSSERISLRAILVTHHHPDHVGGVARRKIDRQPRTSVIAIDYQSLVVGELRAEPDDASPVLGGLRPERPPGEIPDVRRERYG